MRKPDQMTKDKVSHNNNKSKLRKGLWSPEEDEKLMRYMLTNGQGCWSDIARNAGLQRCGKSCRLRWINYLRPDLKRGAFSPREEELIIHLHSILGNRFSLPFSQSLDQKHIYSTRAFLSSGVLESQKQMKVVLMALDLPQPSYVSITR